MAVDIKRYFQAYRSPTWLAVSDPLPQEAPIEQAEIQPTGWVINSTANVIVDEEGLHIFDGAIFLQDYTGAQVLTASGFGGPWVRYAASGNIYNNDFRTSILGTVTESLVGDAETAANYENSISTQIPYWVVESVGDGMSVVADTDAPGGRAIEIVTLNPATQAVIFQDVPITPGLQYIMDFRVKDIGPVGLEGGGRWQVRTEWRDINHALISAPNSPNNASYGLYSELDTTYTRHSIMIGSSNNIETAPANAVFLRLKIQLSEYYLRNSTRFGAVTLVDASPVTGRIKFHNTGNWNDGEPETELYNNMGSATMSSEGGLHVVIPTDPGGYVRVRQGADSTDRVRMGINPSTGNGEVWFGDGAAVHDVKLERTAAYILRLSLGTLLGPSASDQWSLVTYENSWVSYGGGFGGIDYRRDAMGYIHLRGLMRSGTLGAVAFTLPGGYRPSVQSLFVVMQNNAVGRVDINTVGQLTVDAAVNGSNAWVSLNGITFKAEN